MITVHNLTKSFAGRVILDKLNFTVDKGDAVVIIGPSGSGKTTLLRCLNYLEKADQGTMDFSGKTVELSQASKENVHYVRNKSSFVFQNFNLFLNKKVIDNVALPLIAAHNYKKDEARQIAAEALTKVGMGNFLQAYPLSLSGGQQQRVAIARAIASKPDVILFDEPTSALDPEMVKEVLNIIKDLASSGITMIIVTHEIDFARQVATKIIFMEKGNIVETGTSQEIFTQARQERTREFLFQIYRAPEYVI